MAGVDKSGQFVDLDLYVYVLDSAGAMVAHELHAGGVAPTITPGSHGHYFRRI